MTKNLPTDCQILGVDRHGKVIQITAQLRRTGQRSRLAYVGTGAAVAAFVTDTRLLANDGKRWVVKDLVERINTSIVQFETVVRIPHVVEPDPSVEDLWTCLLDASAFRSAESVALRCRDSVADIGTGTFLLLKQSGGGQSFAILSRDELATALGAEWCKTIITLTTRWLRHREEDRVEVERSAYFVALWFATALISSGSGYVFQFDSIQHSSYIFVKVTGQAPPPIQPLSSAFYSPGETNASSLIWSDQSVAPIAGGFLLASG
jgi:hypothetical protein